MVPHTEGTTIGSVSGQTLDNCKGACTEHPKCHSFQYGENAQNEMLCTLKNRVLRESEPTKHHFAYATYYKPCGKWSSFNQYLFLN